MTDDVLDSLFHGCAFAAFLDQWAADGRPPGREATRVRAYRYYEAELAAKNRRAEEVGCETLDHFVAVR